MKQRWHPSAAFLVAAVLCGLAPAGHGQARRHEDQQLVTATRQSLDTLGEAVDVDGDVLVAGGSGIGVGGAAQVYRRVAGTWVEEQLLVPSDAPASQEFGHSVGVHGNWIVVGAWADSQATTFAGAAYVFRWDGATWNEEVKLLASDAQVGDRLGRAVDVHGDVIAVGAAQRDVGFDSNAGSVYVFRWDGAAWVEEQILSEDPDSLDYLGYDVAIHGDAILAGAYGENAAGIDRGEAYLFRHDGASWSLEDTLQASDGADGDWFGLAVGLGDGIACVGALRHDAAGSNAGAAYLYRHSNGVWTEEQKLTGHDTGAADFLGETVSVDGNLALVGANGDDEAGSNSGAAFLFRWTGAQWVEQAKLIASDSANGDSFGDAVAVADDTVVCGIPSDDGSRGAVAVLDAEGLTLDVQPDVAPSGDPVTLWAGGGGPGSPAALFVVDVSGVPFVQLLLYSSFDANGRWSLSGPTTGVPAGTSISFLVFGANQYGKAVASNIATLQVQ